MIEKILGLLVLRIERMGNFSFARFPLGFLSSFNGICKVLLLCYAIFY